MGFQGFGTSVAKGAHIGLRYPTMQFQMSETIVQLLKMNTNSTAFYIKIQKINSNSTAFYIEMHLKMNTNSTSFYIEMH